MKTREQIRNEAKRICNEIDQIFLDAEYWNDEVRKPHELKIDPDPGGVLARNRAALGKMLMHESAPTSG